MHYRFQNILKFSKCFLRCFQHISNIKIHLWYEPCWKLCWGPCQIFQSVLKTILKISRLGGRTAKKGMTWPLCDLLKTYFTELIQLKYKLILWIKTMGCCGLACVVWLKSCELSKRKSVLIVGNSSIMCLLWKFLNLTYLWTFFIFYQIEWTWWVFLLPVRS